MQDLFEGGVKMTLSMDRIRFLHQRWDEECRLFLEQRGEYGDTSPLFLLEECELRMPEIARRWRVPEAELRIFVGLQRYLNLVANSGGDDFPGLEEIAADDLETPFEELEAYCKEQVRRIRSDWEPEDDEIVYPPWWDAAAEEWDLEHDIQQDVANMLGIGEV